MRNKHNFRRFYSKNDGFEKKQTQSNPISSFFRRSNYMELCVAALLQFVCKGFEIAASLQEVFDHVVACAGWREQDDVAWYGQLIRDSDGMGE